MGQELGRRVQKRSMDVGYIEGIGSFIYCTSTKRYLFLLRSNGKYAGTWGVVGGKSEFKETPMQTLFREIQEELGGTIKDPKIIPLEKFTSDNGKFVYQTYITPVDQEFVPILNHEHRGYCWVSLEDHPKPLHPGVWRTINFDVIAEKIKTLESIL